MYINVTALLVPAQYFALRRMNILGIMCIDIYIYIIHIYIHVFFLKLATQMNMMTIVRQTVKIDLKLFTLFSMESTWRLMSKSLMTLYKAL